MLNVATIHFKTRMKEKWRRCLKSEKEEDTKMFRCVQGLKHWKKMSEQVFKRMNRKGCEEMLKNNKKNEILNGGTTGKQE